MPRAFDITSAAPTAKLNASGQGELSFTVSNALGRPVRARINLVPEGNTKREWLSIAGEPERDFAADGTQQVTVRVNAAGAPQGTFSFHVLVSSLNNPDEEYANGPTVSVEAPAAAPPPKKFPWWIVALAAGVVVIIAVAAIIFSKAKGPGLHDACDDKDNKCPGSMACVTPKGATRTECLALAGTKCKDPKDCVTGVCEGEKCQEPPTGSRCAADTDCPQTQKCVDVRAGVKACLLRQDRPCRNDLECASAWCQEDKKVCSRDDGRCDKPEECKPGVLECKNSSCLLTAGQTCSQDQQCATGFCEGTCKPSPPCNPPCNRRLRETCVRGECRPIIIDRIDPFIIREAIPLRRITPSP